MVVVLLLLMMPHTEINMRGVVITTIHRTTTYLHVLIYVTWSAADARPLLEAGTQYPESAFGVHYRSSGANIPRSQQLPP